MKTPDGRLIINIGDGIDSTISGSLSAVSKSFINENDTEYTLFPTVINQPPVILAGIAEASIPPVVTIQAVSKNKLNLYLTEDSITKAATGTFIILQVDATQPDILNVENGVPKIIQSNQRLVYTWRKDGTVINDDFSFLFPGNVGRSANSIRDYNKSLATNQNKLPDPGYIVLENQLILQSINTSFSGLYTCEVSNDISSVTSDELELEVVEYEKNEMFQKNLVENPLGAKGTDGWTSTIGTMQQQEFSREPSERYKRVNNINNFGYTVDMFNPRPYQLNFHDVKNYDINQLINNGTYFTRSKINYALNGETSIVSAYQDIDLTEVQEYIQNSIYGITGVRAIFTCYIGNGITYYRPTTAVVSPNRRKKTQYYVSQKPRLSVENWLAAGPPQLNESVEIILEEYFNENKLSTTVRDSVTNKVQIQDNITLVDPWTKAINKYESKKIQAYPKDIYELKTLSDGSRTDNIILASDDLYKSDQNKYTFGQYVEHNKVIIDRLNFSTNKIRIRINFRLNDWRLFETDPIFTTTTDELYDMMSWDTPIKLGTFLDRDTKPMAITIHDIYKQLNPTEANSTLQSVISKAIPKAGISRGLVTGINLNLIPLISAPVIRDYYTAYYTDTIGSVMSNAQSSVLNVLPNQVDQKALTKELKNLLKI